MLSSFQVLTKYHFFILTSEMKSTYNLTSLDQIFWSDVCIFLQQTFWCGPPKVLK